LGDGGIVGDDVVVNIVRIIISLIIMTGYMKKCLGCSDYWLGTSFNVLTSARQGTFLRNACMLPVCPHMLLDVCQAQSNFAYSRRMNMVFFIQNHYCLIMNFIIEIFYFFLSSINHLFSFIFLLMMMMILRSSFMPGFLTTFLVSSV
jgi:hypothetical protein